VEVSNQASLIEGIRRGWFVTHPAACGAIPFGSKQGIREVRNFYLALLTKKFIIMN
jgi:hypothetical protein